MKRKPFFHLILFITILVLTSLACQAVTDIFEDDYGYYDEEYADEFEEKYESDFEEDTAENTPDNENPATENNEPATKNICPVVTENILSAATQVEDDFRCGLH